jgi:hypothetical protein
MKKVLAVLALVLFGTISYAQWSAGPGNLYMLSAGQVGIGITAPNADLTVSSTTDKADLFIRTQYSPPVPVGTATATTGQMEIWGDAAGTYLYRNVVRLNSSSQYEMLQTIKTPSGNLAFLFVNFATKTFRIREGIQDIEYLNTGVTSFNGPGAIGIGMGATAIPAGAKLAVAGKVVCKEIEVTLTGLPDYVFSSDYKLRSLYDVENFINTNKHLPDVPSAKEVVENGLNLGDMNATLLQKVEELTLYMIQLQKENDALKVRVSSLEK